MRATLTASTGTEILVWRQGDLFAARQADAVQEPQVCLGVDLFEVMAELASLDLDDRRHAAEAVALSEEARRQLAAAAAATDRGDGRAEGTELDASEHR